LEKFWEIKELLPEFEAVTVFDVGANIGMSTAELGAVYPEATVYAFEPIASTFALLQARFGDSPRVKPFQLAMGDVPGSATMSVGPKSLTSKIIETGEGETVTVVRGDDFCEEHGIQQINYLKIDAEGYDLKVCSGFRTMLKENRIDFVQVEAGLNPTNRVHVPLEAFKEYLEPLGYALFRIYDQAGRPFARRCNPLFMSVGMGYANPNPMRGLVGELKRMAKRFDRVEKANNRAGDEMGEIRRSVADLQARLEELLRKSSAQDENET